MLDLLSLVLKIVVLAALILIVFTFLYGVMRVSDLSMKPSMADGDLVLYYRLDQRMNIGDVAVVRYQDRDTVARVVATQGDEVDITEDGLMVNGAIQSEQAIYFDTTQFVAGVHFPLMVGENQVFLLGDNRPSATDSRIYGCVDLADVKGKVIAVIRTRGV